MPRLLSMGAAGQYFRDPPPPPPFPSTDRDTVLGGFATAFIHEYLFEGGTATYLDDENAVKNVTGGASGDPTFGGIQLSGASVDSVNFGNADARHTNWQAGAPTPLETTVLAVEFWYRQPDLSQTVCDLIGSQSDDNVILGRESGVTNFPNFRNHSPAFTFWEPEVDLYGDNKIHQLVEAHDVGTPANYIVYIDGIPVASGTNDGLVGANANGGWSGVGGGPCFNGNSAQAAADRSGADFGSCHMYNNGQTLSQLDVRQLYEASALPGQDMLTNPQWCVLDSENTTTGGTGLKDATLGDVNDATGIRSYAIPRNGKVYFEMFIIAQGDNAAGSRLGIRKLTEGNAVGGFAANGADGYLVSGGQLLDGAGVSVVGQDGLSLANFATNRTYQFAIDFDTGDWWVGDSTNYKGSGTPGSANPSTGTDGLGSVAPISLVTNWAAWTRTNGTLGNGQVRLVTASADFVNSIPTGFSAWEDAIA